MLGGSHKLKDVGGYYCHMEAREEEVFFIFPFFSYTTLRVHTTMVPLSTNNKLFFLDGFHPSLSSFVWRRYSAYSTTSPFSCWALLLLRWSCHKKVDVWIKISVHIYYSTTVADNQTTSFYSGFLKFQAGEVWFVVLSDIQMFPLPFLKKVWHFLHFYQNKKWKVLVGKLERTCQNSPINISSTECKEDGKLSITFVCWAFLGQFWTNLPLTTSSAPSEMRESFVAKLLGVTWHCQTPSSYSKLASKMRKLQSPVSGDPDHSYLPGKMPTGFPSLSHRHSPFFSKITQGITTLPCGLTSWYLGCSDHSWTDTAVPGKRG